MKMFGKYTLATGSLIIISSCFFTTGTALCAKVVRVWGFGGPGHLAQSEKAYWARASKELKLKVEFTAMTSFQDYLDKLAMSTAAGVGPDVVTRFDFQFAAKNMYTDLGPYIIRDRYDLRRFNSTVVKDITVNGKLLGIPDSTNPATLVYNKALFAQAGLAEPSHDWTDKSWNTTKFLEYGKKLTQLTEDRSKYERIGVCTMQTEMYWPKMFGGDWVDSSGNITADSPAVIKAYEFMIDMIENAIMPGLGRKNQGFEGGKVGMMVQGCWDLPNLANAIKNRFKFDLAPVPMGTTRSTIVWWDASVIMKSSKRKDDAWRLIKWMHQPKNAGYFFTYRGYAPFGPELVDEYKAQAGKAMPGVDLKMVTDAAHYGGYPAILKLRQGSNIQNLIGEETNRLFTKSGDVRTFTKRLQAGIKALLARR